MHNPHTRLGGGGTYSMRLVSVGCAALIVFLSSCSTDLRLRKEAQPAEESVPASPYSIVFIIHGDGEYRYHDANGNELEADEVALAGAERVAQQNPLAEVFIFHQRARRHFLFVFPRRDGEFSYYRNGRLVAEESYWRDREQSSFNPELGLYRRFRANNERRRASLLLYFGHEIPEVGGAGYNASFPNRAFTVHDLAAGLRGFTPDSARLDLMVLSTCFGGTPYTIGTLGFSAKTIIASPGNLHLSYFDLASLERLDLGLQDGDVPAFAERFAERAFERLTRDIQTAVSVAVYDVDRVQGFLRSVHGTYDRTLTTLKAERQATIGASERCDCADLPAYVLPTMTVGVEIFYRPARFGRLKDKRDHSGWECWKEKDKQAAASSAEAIPE